MNENKYIKTDLSGDVELRPVKPELDEFGIYGARFGALKVKYLAKTPLNPNKWYERISWVCECQNCSRTEVFTTGELLSGYARRCSVCQKEYNKVATGNPNRRPPRIWGSFIGRKIGHLLAVRRVYDPKSKPLNRGVVLKCICTKCGKMADILASTLSQGRALSCKECARKRNINKNGEKQK